MSAKSVLQERGQQIDSTSLWLSYQRGDLRQQRVNTLHVCPLQGKDDSILIFKNLQYNTVIWQVLHKYLLLMLKTVITFRICLRLSILEAQLPSTSWYIRIRILKYKAIHQGFALLHSNPNINQHRILLSIYHCHHARKKIRLPISTAELKGVVFNLLVMKTWNNCRVIGSSRWD